MLSQNIVVILNNSALLICLGFLYDVLTFRKVGEKTSASQIVTGLILGAIGIAVMFNHLELKPGVVFDTRSVLLCITGFFFGTVPVVITILMTASYRLYLGGPGVWMGIGVVLTSGLIGLAWRHKQRNNFKNISWQQLYLLGIIVHGVMLGLVLLLPQQVRMDVFASMALPMMVIYPVITVLLGLLMKNRHKNKLLKTELVQSEQRFQNAMNASQDGIYDWDLETKTIYYSPGWKRMLGYEPDELPNDFSVWETLTHSDDVNACWAMVNEVVEGKRKRFEKEFKMRHKNGHWVDIFSRSSLYKDDYSERVHVVGTHVDITERKRTELKLQENSNNLKAIFDNAPNVLAIVDEQVRVEKINRKGASLVGKDKGTLSGLLCGDVFDCRHSFQGDGCGTNPECPKCPLRTRVLSTYETGDPHIEEKGQMTFMLSGGEKTMDLLISTSLLDISGNKKVLLSLTDITDLKQIEDSLQESKEFLTATLDGLSANIALLDNDGIILLVNKSWRAFAEENGLSADDVSEGKNYLHICDNSHGKHGKEASVVSDGIRAVLSGEISHFELEYPCHSPNEERWFICRVTVFPGGVPRRAVVAHENITERKKAEENNIKIRQEIESIFRSAPTGIGVVSNRMIVQVNNKVEEISGYSQHELHGQSARVFYPTDEDFDYVGQESSRQIQLHGTGTLETKWRRKDGRIIDVLMSSTPIDYDDYSKGVTFTVMDITDRKLTEQALTLQSLILDQIQDHVTATDLEGNIIYVNRAECLSTKRSKDELLGSSVDIYGEDPERGATQTHIAETTLAAGQWRGEVVNYASDGTEIIMDCRTKLIKDKLGNPTSIVGVSTDITRQKAISEKLQQAQKMESIGSLAGGIAHDFNNILFPILGLAEMLTEDLPPDSPEYVNAQEIFKAGTRGAELVNQILAFSRQEAHKLIPTRAQQVMKEVVKLTRSTIPMNISIVKDLQPNCGLIMADATQIHQIGMNLITNAYHAVEETDKGQISVKVREVVLDAQATTGMLIRPGKYVMLSVGDNGVGIAQANLVKIFDPYFTTKARGKGTGLGLSVIYGIVKEHKGDIKVQSELGKGTMFEIYLPLMVTEAISESDPENVYIEGGTERILIIDDEGPIAALEKQMLERLGYRVSIRTSSLDALEAFKASPDAYDLIITDMSMPNMTGEQLAREVLATRSDIPVIINTGFSERLTKENAMEMGVKGFLMKPIGKADLAREVRRVLDGRSH